MNSWYLVRTVSVAVVASITLNAQVSREHVEIPLKNWQAPLYWQPAQVDDTPTAGRLDHLPALSPQATTPTSPAVFIAITPCRVIDTRAAAGFPSPFGAPTLPALLKRTFPIQSSTLCSIPAAALAYSLDVTVVPVATAGVSPLGYLGFLTLYPTGAAIPNASTLNNYLGTVVANAAVVPAGDSGSIDAYAHDATDMIVDINGYYVPGTGGSGATATVSVGTTTTGAPGTQAAVSNAGSSTAAVLNFTIPQGIQGSQGAIGPQGGIGPQGPSGPPGPTGPAGQGVVSVFDANNNVLGSALAIAPSGVTVYRNGYIVSLNFDGSVTPTPIYWTAANCSGTPYFENGMIGQITSNKIVYYSLLHNSFYVASVVTASGFQANSADRGVPPCDSSFSAPITGWPLIQFDSAILGWQLSGTPLRVPGPIEF